jgi:hypothetical protein
MNAMISIPDFKIVCECFIEMLAEAIANLPQMRDDLPDQMTFPSSLCSLQTTQFANTK